MKALMEDDEEPQELQPTKSAEPTEQRRGLPPVRSGLNLNQNYIEAKDGHIDVKEKEFKQ